MEKYGVDGFYALNGKGFTRFESDFQGGKSGRSAL